MTHGYCPFHSYLKDGMIWKKVRNLNEELEKLGKPAFMADCPDCIAIKEANERFKKQYRNSL